MSQLNPTWSMLHPLYLKHFFFIIEINLVLFQIWSQSHPEKCPTQIPGTVGSGSAYLMAQCFKGHGSSSARIDAVAPVQIDSFVHKSIWFGSAILTRFCCSQDTSKMVYSMVNKNERFGPNEPSWVTQKLKNIDHLRPVWPKWAICGALKNIDHLILLGKTHLRENNHLVTNGPLYMQPRTLRMHVNGYPFEMIWGPGRTGLLQNGQFDPGTSHWCH